MIRVLGDTKKEVNEMSNKKKNYSKISTEKVKAEQNVESEIVTSIDVPPEPVAEIVEEKTTPAKTYVGTVTGCIKLNVRMTANPNAEILTTINKGTEVTIEGEDNGFYFVRKDNTTEGFSGWCMKKYISIKK